MSSQCSAPDRRAKKIRRTISDNKCLIFHGSRLSLTVTKKLKMSSITKSSTFIIAKDFELIHESLFCKLYFLHAFVVHKDRKSTRLNSSHANISYAVFCLK